jgi:hypothetical protein
MDDIEIILESGLRAAGYRDLRVNNAGKLEKFRKLYGLDPDTVHDLFVDLQSDDVIGDKALSNSELKTLFLTIYWLKSYDTEEGVIRVFGICSKVTFRRHTRMCLDALQALCQAKVFVLKSNRIL